MNYFTADTHFFHKSLIHDRIFSNRDFLCVEEMNEQIMDAWNEVVCDQDTVYHLGDIALVDGKTKEYEKVDQLLKSLNGQIVFIKGNHDSRAMFKYLEKHNATLQNARKKYLFNDVGLILKFDKKQFFLTHYPLIVGNKGNRINLHGHIHRSTVNLSTCLNVGIDSPEADYLMGERSFGQPFSETEILKMIKAKRDDFGKR